MSSYRITAAVLTAAFVSSLIGAPTTAAAPVAPVQATHVVVEALTPGHTATAVRGASEASGAWYVGHQLATRSLCIESTIPGFPLARTAWLYNTSKVLRVAWSNVAGGCAKAGYALGQRVLFIAMTAAEKTRTGNCAEAQSWVSGGFSVRNTVKVNLTGPQKTACGGGWEWLDLAAHELGHVVGFSHEQPSMYSVMRAGHGLSAGDVWRLTLTYNNNPER